MAPENANDAVIYTGNKGNVTQEVELGEGYHNYSTLSSPTATYVTTSKVSIAFGPDLDHPDGFMLDSAYPKFVPE